METTLRVTGVRLIDKNAKGEAINRVFIDVDKTINGTKVALSRSQTQFLQDMENSFLIPQGIRNIRDTRVLRAIKNIKGGTVEGAIAFQKKGDKYVITENHPALTRTNHPLYGKVVLGEEVVVENDGARVTEGFLSFDESDKGVKYNAIKDAQMEIAMIGNFFTPSDAVASNVPMGSAEDAFEDENGDFNAAIEGETIESEAEHQEA